MWVLDDDLGRGERIRTSGLYVPNVALYQAKLHPEVEPEIVANLGWGFRASLDGQFACQIALHRAGTVCVGTVRRRSAERRGRYGVAYGVSD